MLNWDKILEILIGIVLVTITLTLSLDLYMSIGDTAKREQKKLLASDVAYSYKLNEATHTNGVVTGNARDRNNNGIPDYLEKGQVEAPDSPNPGSVQPINQCINLNELRVQYNSLVTKLPIEISTHTKYVYLGEAVLDPTQLIDLDNFLKTYSYNLNATYCITVLSDQFGPYKYLIEEVDPSVVTIAYEDGDYLNYQQVMQLFNLGLTNYEISLKSLTNQTHNQLRDSSSVNTVSIHNIGFNTDSWAKIKIHKDSYKVDSIELIQVDLSVIPGDLINPQQPTSPEAPEEPPVEEIEQYPDIDWVKACVGDLQRYYNMSDKELGYSSSTKSPNLIYTKGTRIYSSKDLSESYDYISGITSSISILTEKGYSVVNSKVHLDSLSDATKNYHLQQLSNEDGTTSVKIVELPGKVPTNVNGAVLTKAQVESFMYIDVDENFYYRTMDGIDYNKDNESAWVQYLSTVPDTDKFYTEYSTDGQGNIKYVVTHSKQETESLYANKALITFEELKELIDKDGYNIRVSLLNAVSIDFRKGSPINSAPNHLSDYLNGNLSSGVFEISPRFEGEIGNTVSGYAVTETDTISYTNLPMNSQWVSAGYYGSKNLLNSYYINKGYFKCN